MFYGHRTHTPHRVHLSPGQGMDGLWCLLFGSINNLRVYGFIELEVDYIQTSFRQMPLHWTGARWLKRLQKVIVRRQTWINQKYVYSGGRLGRGRGGRLWRWGEEDDKGEEEGEEEDERGGRLSSPIDNFVLQTWRLFWINPMWIVRSIINSH